MRLPALAWLAMACSSGIAGAGTSAPRCPGAQAWLAANPQTSDADRESRDQSRAFTNPALRQELKNRFDAEQRARESFSKAPHNPFEVRNWELADADNRYWLRRFNRKAGLPSVTEVGEAGMHWLLVLVARNTGDPQFQSNMLSLFADRYAAGDISADDLAQLNDQTLWGLGRPQRYGTRLVWDKDGYKVEGRADITEVEASRAELGLMPLADYVCRANALYPGRPTYTILLR